MEASKINKLYIIAGEASGDLHAANLMKSIKELNPNVDFRFFGGDKMAEVGGKLRKHYKELAFMGLWEVLKNINTIKNNMKFCKNDIKSWQPDAVILVDYPGFNMKIAEFAHSLGIKVYYYISPKVWVWKKSRIPKIKKFVDKLFVIFPFEVDFFRQYNYNVFYYGNPSFERVTEELNSKFDKKLFREQNNLSDKKIIALLPGSREQEVSKMLPIMVNVSLKFPDYQCVIAGVSNLGIEIYHRYTAQSDVKIIFDKTFDLYRIASCAVVTSGTATLETALFKVPQVVCYSTAKINYLIGNIFVNIEYFSLVNILMQKEVVKEFLQKDLENDITNELKRILYNAQYRRTMLNNYKKLIRMLGQKDCSLSIAEEILEF